MQFLVSNGDTAAADTLASILTSNPTAVLPAALWGNVSVSSLQQSQVQITVPRELLTTPATEASDDKTPLIVGLVVGREREKWGERGRTCVCTRLRAKPARCSHRARCLHPCCSWRRAAGACRHRGLVLAGAPPRRTGQRRARLRGAARWDVML